MHCSQSALLVAVQGARQDVSTVQYCDVQPVMYSLQDWCRQMHPGARDELISAVLAACHNKLTRLTHQQQALQCQSLVTASQGLAEQCCAGSLPSRRAHQHMVLLFVPHGMPSEPACWANKLLTKSWSKEAAAPWARADALHKAAGSGGDAYPCSHATIMGVAPVTALWFITSLTKRPQPMTALGPSMSSSVGISLVATLRDSMTASSTLI